MLKKLTCESIGDLANGAAAKAINRAIRVAVADLDDRGAEDHKERIVNIQITMAHVNGMNVVDVRAGTKLPSFRTPATQGMARQKDAIVDLFFQDANAENPEQPTFRQMDIDPESGEVPE